MRWSLLYAVFGLSVTCVASFAQGQPGDQPPAAGRSASETDGLFATTGMIQFELIQGRLELDALRHRKGSQQQTTNGHFETISVSAERGIPSLHYVHQSPVQHLSVSVHQARILRVESWLVARNERAVLSQPAVGTISFSVVQGDIDDRYHGATLIHVRHGNRASFDRHFELLIERMLRGSSLRELSDAAEQRVLTQAQDATLPDPVSVRIQVDKLRSPHRATRVMAERQLLTWGTPAIALLESIPTRDLDAEQRARVRSIASQLRSDVGDTPASLAKLLVNDRTYWSAVSTRLSSEQMQIASDHLRRLGVDPLQIAGEPVERIASAAE